MVADPTVLAAAAVVVLTTLAVVCLRRPGGGAAAHEEAKAAPAKAVPAKKKAGAAKKGAAGAGPAAGSGRTGKKARAPTHKLYHGALKGQTKAVTGVGFSPNGKLCAVASEDRTVRVFAVETIGDPSPRFSHISVEYDHAVAIAFSEDSGYLAMALDRCVGLEVLQLGMAANGHVESKRVLRTEKVHKSTLVSVGMSASARVLMAASDDEEISIRAVSKSADVLATVKTHQFNNRHAVLSDDAKFVACAAFTSDVKIWEVTKSKDGVATGLKKVMDLKGHTSAARWVDFGKGSTRAVTASKDGTIKVWDIDVRYAVNEDPHCLTTITKDDGFFDMALLSPDLSTIAAVAERDIFFFDAASGEELGRIPGEHPGVVRRLAWAPDSKMIAAGDHSGKCYLWLKPQ